MNRLVRQPKSIYSCSVKQTVGQVEPVLGLFYLEPKQSEMAITREKKEAIVEKLAGVKASSESIVFVNFKGLSVAESTDMRSKLRESGVQYFVTKKSLIKRALGDGFEGDMPALEGEIALAYSDDPMAPAQTIKECANTYKNRVSIVGGVFYGTYKNQEEMTEIASIPSLHVLRGMFVNVINSPIQGLAVALNAIADKKS